MLLIERFQRRLLNSNKVCDYFLLFCIALIPIPLSIQLNIWNPISTGCGHTAFKEAINFISHIFILPLSLWLIRFAGDSLFGININYQDRQRVRILRFFKGDYQDKIHGDLKKTILNFQLPIIILIIDLIHHIFDLGEVLRHYYLSYTNTGIEIEHNCSVKDGIDFFSQKKYIYWANLFLLTNKKDFSNDIDINVNLIFTIITYLSQFILIFIILMGIAMLLLYNLFYLKLIYRRKRIKNKGNEIGCYIVLNFYDVSHRFGLSELNPVFNLQICILIIAGFLALVSRYTVVPKEKHFNFLQSIKDFQDHKFDYLNPDISFLFSEYGQYALAVGWLLAFIIVLLPSFVKFLPLWPRGIFSDELTIQRYLQEFIPDNEEFIPGISGSEQEKKIRKQLKLETETDVDEIAAKFLQNSFWPMGDGITKVLFYFVFFVFYLLLVPISFDGITLFLSLTVAGILSYLTAELLFYLIYSWSLKNLDRRLGERSSLGQHNLNQQTIYIDRGNYVQGTYKEKHFNLQNTQFGGSLIDADSVYTQQISSNINNYTSQQNQNSKQVKTILILAANPKTTTPVRLDEEVREIDAGLQRAKKREQFDLKQRWAVRVQDVYQSLLDLKPQYVHFSGHGEGDDGLVLEDETGNIRLVNTQALVSLFKLFASHIECVVLNACYSEVQASAIAQHIPYVIGMNKAIGDKAAIKFATGFYSALGNGESVEFAYKLGCSVIQLEGIPEHLIPELKKN